MAIERGKAQTVIVLAIMGLKDLNIYYRSEAEVFWKVTPKEVKVLYA